MDPGAVVAMALPPSADTATSVQFWLPAEVSVYQVTPAWWCEMMAQDTRDGRA